MLHDWESVKASVGAAVSVFGAAVLPRLAGPGQPEDQMRGPLENLMQAVGAALGHTIVAHGESLLSELKVRPDYAIEVDGAPCGYLEVKAPGKGADPLAWSQKSHDYKQWQRLAALPNVLYTDGNEWCLYRSGRRIGDVAVLNLDVRSAGVALSPTGDSLARALSSFLRWSPTPPTTIEQLVTSVAGLCRLLRDEVQETLNGEQKAGIGPFTSLAADWRELLFPDATDPEFADGYAQTVTFSLLLARVEGIEFPGRSVSEISRLLGKEHLLLGKALSILTDESLGDLTVTLDTLLRVVGVVQWELFEKEVDPYLHLYEKFLDFYDRDLRKRTGSYYTPVEVVSSMVRLTDSILRRKLGQPLGFASDQVVVVDPAMGTGTYLLNLIERAAEAIAGEEGPGAVAPRLREMAKRVIGFEKQMGPYAVAELRGHEALRRHKSEVPAEGLRWYVADTLENPYAEELHVFAGLRPIAESRRAANRVKRDEPVVVVIGNPPYGDKAKGRGGWIEKGNPLVGQPPPLNDFRAPGNGIYEKTLLNLHAYFWRWGTWKVFDAHPAAPAGVIAYITTSAYLSGPGFAGMREYLRRQADEGWVIDLTPEGPQPPVSTRIFPGVQQAIG